MNENAVKLSSKPGRPCLLTEETVNTILQLIEIGYSQTAARIKMGISNGCFYQCKKRYPKFAEAIKQARYKYWNNRFNEHQRILNQSRSLRNGQRVGKARPLRQAKFIMWHLITRIPLNLVSISTEEENEACARFNLSFDVWRQQSQVFGLMRKVYEKRARLRNQQTENAQVEHPAQIMSSSSRTLNSHNFTATGFYLGH